MIESYLAAHRFGLGPRPGEPERIGKDPRSWIRGQMKAPLLAGAGTTRQWLEALYARKEMAKEDKRAFMKERVMPEVWARFEQRIRSEQPFAERMVAFWSNHFTVSLNGRLGALAPVYEREAIRPHVFGSFRDLLFSAVTHPAMLDYLDNTRSVGPNSLFGRRGKRNLNENLAREVLELHTLGVNGGYTQADVEALAAVLSGWAVWDPRLEKRRERFESRLTTMPFSIDIGAATFYPIAHEPGKKRVLGKRYAEAGADELRTVLNDLATHSSTATFVATKLVRHFVADRPPKAAVDTVARRFRETEGDLRSVLERVIDLDGAWSPRLVKAKTPEEYCVATLRATMTAEDDLDQAGRRVLDALLQMGQRPFSAPSPKGWPDTAAAWLTPGSLMRRIEWAQSLARFRRQDARTLLDGTLGPLASDETRKLVQRAASPTDGTAFVFASREFQRR